MPNKIIKPHRGKASVMSDSTKKNMVLENGELFIEIPDNVTNDNQYKIKIGDGVTTYENLKYAFDPSDKLDRSEISSIISSNISSKADSSDLNETNRIILNNGAINILKPTISSQVVNNITITVEYVTGALQITASGTASADTSIKVGTIELVKFQTNKFGDPDTDIRLLGCPSSGSSTTYKLQANGNTTANDTGSGAWTNPGVDVYLHINSGTNMSNVVFYPKAIPNYDSSCLLYKWNDMIPYASSNQCLTENKVNKSGDYMTGRLVFNGNADTFGSYPNGIWFKGTNAEYSMIRFLDNKQDSYGNGILIGGGGWTCIGGGESVNTFTSGYISASGISEQNLGATEFTGICSDGSTEINTNLQDGYTYKKTFNFGADGNIVCPGTLYVRKGGSTNYEVARDPINYNCNYYRTNPSSTTAGTTVSCTNGSVQTWSFNFATINGKVVGVLYFDLRISDLPVNTIPTATLTNSMLANIGAFSITIPIGYRGPVGSQVPSGGGYISHTAGSNTMTFYSFNYAASQPAGYLHVIK